MPFRKINNGVKERTLQLIAEGWPLEQVIEAMGVSRRSINRWADNYEDFGSVKPPAVITGRPRVLNPTAVEGLYDLLVESPELYLDEIAEYLALYHDLPISTTALHDNLTELGLTWKIMRRAALERDDALRAACLKIHFLGIQLTKWFSSTNLAKMDTQSSASMGDHHGENGL